MVKEKSKTRFVGVRMTKKQGSILSRLQKNSNLSKTDVLLKGLEILAEYYSLGLDQRPLSLELRTLEEEAIRHVEELKRIRRREEAIKEMIQEFCEVDEVLDKYEGDKSALIQILLDIQTHHHWLPKPMLMWVSKRLEIPIGQIYHIATFYKIFSLVPQGRHIVQVCTGTACHVRGSPRLLDKVTKVLKLRSGETDEEQKFTLTTVNCLGCCALGPVMVVDGIYHGNPSLKEIKEIVANCN
jgi:NADH-quinone oxidoreductase subunit E